MGSIQLHRKHGVNPTMPICFYCGEEKGEIVLLGAASKKITGQDEAPRHICLDKEPCDKCKEMMSQGVMLIGVRDGDTPSDNPYRTGEICVITDDAARRMFQPESMVEDVLQRRCAFIEQSVLRGMMPEGTFGEGS